MRFLLHIFLLFTLTTQITACGNKGNLKTPDQIEKEAAKKAAKKANSEQEQEEK
jgi:predicted small lipoprotein YifL